MEKLQQYLDSVSASAASNENNGFIDTSDPNLYTIIFNPVFWNIIARAEYHTHILTRTFGTARKGCYVLALTIFSLGILRDQLYKAALDSQPLTPQVHQPWVGAALFVFGQVLVLSSMWALGLTGTYLGDYFGILMDHKVEGFPFNLSIALGAPMYVGSTLCFLGTALWTGRGAGLVLTVLVALAYAVATVWFEDPFTSMIYANKEAKSATADGNSRKEYHWAFLIGPKAEHHEPVAGKRYHVKNSASGWTYEEVEVNDVRSTISLLVRIRIAKITDERRLVALLRRLPVVQDDPSWRCRTWVANALAEIARDGKCVGTAELDWSRIEAAARGYVADKAASGRYESGADMTKPKPTWDMVENKEIVS
ncbi:hypothetical protein DV738_g2803, partial [Chaetothyriales sp. CBS 135597]